MPLQNNGISLNEPCQVKVKLVHFYFHETRSTACLYNEYFRFSSKCSILFEWLYELVDFDWLVNTVHDALIAMTHNNTQKAVGLRVVGSGIFEKQVPEKLSCAIVSNLS